MYKDFKQNLNHVATRLAILIFTLEFYHEYYSDVGLDTVFIDYLNRNQCRGTARSPVTSQGPFLLITTGWGEDNGIAADTSLRPSDLNVAIWVTRLHWQVTHRSIPCLYFSWVSSSLIASPPGSPSSVRRFHSQEVKEGYPCYGLESPIISKLVKLNYMLSSSLPFLLFPILPTSFLLFFLPPSPSPLLVFSPAKKKIAILYLSSVRSRSFPGLLGSTPVSFVSGLLGSTLVSFVSGQPQTVHLSITISYLWA